MRYTKEEIDEMGDKEAYRRYFSALNLMTQMAGGGSGKERPLGGGPSPQQTRSRRSSSRRSTPTSSPDSSPSQDKADSTYNFPR